MTKVTYAHLLFLLLFAKVYSQSSVYPAAFDKVIPASPQAMEFKKYGDYPVDLSSGLTQVSIPLYNVQSRSMTIPLDLSFHTSGIKVDQRDGIIGWGWSLNAGGMVSRVINGSPDENFNTPYP